MKKLLILPALALLACFSAAQGGPGRFMRMGGGGAGLQLALRKDVQKELKLTDDQVSALEKYRDEQQEKRREMMSSMQSSGGRPDMAQMRPMMEKWQAESKEKVKSTLTADQYKRLKEINIQMSGNMVLLDKDTQKELGLSEAQTDKIKDLQSKQESANRDVFEKMRAGEIDRSQIGEIMKKNNEIMKTELGKVLTADQAKKLTTMAGAKFTPDADEEE